MPMWRRSSATSRPAIRAGQPQVSAGTATAAITADPNGGAAITSVTGSEGCTVAPQGDGSYLLTTSANGTYTVTATNALGKTAQTTVTVSGIDSTPPVIGEPTVSYSEDRKTATVSLSVTDEGGVASVTFAGIEMSASGGSYQASVSQNGSLHRRSGRPSGQPAVRHRPGERHRPDPAVYPGNEREQYLAEIPDGHLLGHR